MVAIEVEVVDAQEVKKIFNSISEEDGKLITPMNDLIQRLWMVDSVERLGVDSVGICRVSSLDRTLEDTAYK